MKLLFVTKALAAGPGGGAERIVAQISNALADRGQAVTILTFDAPGSEDFYALDDCVGRVRLGLGETTKRSSALMTGKRLVRIRAVAKRLSPDVAVGFMHSAFIPLGLALAGSGIPVIGSERTAYQHYRTRPVQRLLLRACLPFLDKLTVNNEGVRQGFPDPIARKMLVIHNPVQPARELADPVGKRERTLLSVGGLRPEKDHLTLIRAFAQIANRLPEWRLRIVGEGPLRKELQQQIRALGMTHRITLVGPVRDVASEYSRAHLFVLPSIYEGFPNCLAEALAHGLPAVGFADCPGTNELILSDVNGLLAMGANRSNVLANVLGELMSDPTKRRRYAFAARASVERYSLDSAAAQWELLFQNVLQSANR